MNFLKSIFSKNEGGEKGGGEEKEEEDLEKGPPFYVNLDDTLLMFKNNFNIIKIDKKPDSIKPRKGFETLVIMDKK